ncbi:lamin tail domain-containing protein [Aliifodinibius sp. S!AR15-10]|uniref:lamin tail domain-containing protein n=1 Tax=Aliifodinibius sp. S!AR15-10 TaxID=2950437 RepID=UPI00285AB378|nr:lamin tail domain-containing protein [Aliifodinibius sp. S!AR15-10]MDR8389673.1 lamin tail domain-containing protein [Aliifodinibius sp. S!AR15-10]
MRSRVYINPLILAIISFLWIPGVSAAQPLKIFHIDVEQGDATLFVSPNNKTLLVDSGKNGHGARINSILQELQIDTIDVFVNTHYHEDHYGGVDELVRDFNIHIRRTYDRGDKDFISDSKRNQASFQDYYEFVGHRATHLTRGMSIPFDEEIDVTCIASGGVVLGEVDPVPAVYENDMSLALLLQFREFKYFIAGDIGVTTEDKIAHRDIVTSVDVYQANHHGSHTSSSWLLLEDLRPTVVVISNGNHAGYMHPRATTLNKFKMLDPQPAVFQTNKYYQGRLGANTADEFIADLESVDQDGTIEVAVDNETTIITVRYRDQEMHFPVKRAGEKSPLKIESLLPNPIGPDRQLELVTIKNTSDDTIPLSGWFLRDRSGKVWTLSLEQHIEPHSTLKFIRNGMAMSLNNDGDEIILINPSNEVVDRFQYSGSTEGEIIFAN